MSRVILHVDLNNFYASVECKLNPAISHLPVAVAGSPEKRHGVVLAKNQIAKELGVKTGDTVIEACRKAPDIVFVSPNLALYEEYSKEMFKLCEQFTSHVEPFGSDECWLDCTGSIKLFGSGENIANELRSLIKEKLGLTASVGVSFSKIFAKLGSDMKKPDATTIIDKNNFKRIVWPLAVNEMCGIGHRLTERLNKINIKTLGDLAKADENIIKYNFGKVGVELQMISRGEEIGEIREAIYGREIKSVGHGLTTLRDLENMADIKTLVYHLSEMVSFRLFKHSARGRGIAVNLRTNTLVNYGKRKQLSTAFRSVSDIANYALEVINEIYDGRPLRSMSISVFDIVSQNAPEQLSMFGNNNSEKNEKLDKTLNSLRTKYGKNTIYRASTIANNNIFTDKDLGDFLPFKR